MCWTAGNATRSTCAAVRMRRNLSARSCAPTSGLALASLMRRYQPDHQRADHRPIGVLRAKLSAGCPPADRCELPGAAAFLPDELFSTIPFVSAPDDSLAYAYLLHCTPLPAHPLE